MGASVAKTRGTEFTVFTHHQNENAKMKSRTDIIKNATIKRIASYKYQLGTATKTIIVVCAYDVKGGAPHNKKHIKYEGGGKKTHMSGVDRLKSGMRIHGRDGPQHRTLVCHGEKCRYHLDCRIQKRLVM